MFARTFAASVLVLAGTAVGSPGCALDGGACICEDAAGQTWDLTELTAPAAGAASQVVAVGACSGAYCQGSGFQYFIDICGTMNPPTSCYSGVCCSAIDTLNMYRLDTRADCPPGTTCQVNHKLCISSLASARLLCPANLTAGACASATSSGKDPAAAYRWRLMRRPQVTMVTQD